MIEEARKFNPCATPALSCLMQCADGGSTDIRKAVWPGLLFSDLFPFPFVSAQLIDFFCCVNRVPLSTCDACWGFLRNCDFLSSIEHHQGGALSSIQIVALNHAK